VAGQERDLVGANLILGIDPGKDGAFVVIDENGTMLYFKVMPLGPDDQPHYEGIKEVLMEINKAHYIPLAYLERAMPMAMGAKHAFNYGRGFAALEIALREVGIPYSMLEPSKWTKDIFQGIDSNLKAKAQASIAVSRLFPEEHKKIPTSPRSKKMHDGIIDALLMAEYGRRQIKRA